METLDYKISCLNSILKMVIKHIREGMKKCSLLDPKYFGEYSSVIVKCQEDFDEIEKLLEDFNQVIKIPYFGCPPAEPLDIYSDIALTKYYKEYLWKVARRLNHKMDEYLIKELVAEQMDVIAKHYNSDFEDRKPINSKLVFYTLLKLVERSIKFRKLRCVYKNVDIQNHPIEVLMDFKAEKTFKHAEERGMFPINLAKPFQMPFTTYLTNNPTIKKRDLKRIYKFPEEHKSSKKYEISIKRQKIDQEEFAKNAHDFESKKDEPKKQPQISPYDEFDYDDVSSTSSRDSQEMTMQEF